MVIAVKVEAALSEKEQNLLRYIRSMKFGKILVRVEDSKPVMLENLRENIQL